MSPHKNSICTVCGLGVASLVLEKPSDSRGVGGVVLHQCVGCGTVFLASHESSFDEVLYTYYRKYAGQSRCDVYDRLTCRSYAKVLRLLARHTLVRSILDVGCGKGDFVSFASDQGIDAVGIDLAQSAIDIGRSFGINISKNDFFSPSIVAGSYDVVTMFELIEHVPNPAEFLQRAEAVVRPGGLVYITTPNFNSIDRRVLASDWDAIHREHLTYFTRKTLLALITARTSLRVVHAETRNVTVQLLGRVLPMRRSRSRNRQQGAAKMASAGHVDWRAVTYASHGLQVLKSAANAVLNATSLGSTLVVLMERKR